MARVGLFGPRAFKFEIKGQALNELSSSRPALSCAVQGLGLGLGLRLALGLGSSLG